MTEERKQELRQLLEEAMKNLEIRQRSADGFPLPPIDIRGYRAHLQQYWKSYSETSLWVVMAYEPNIGDENARSKLLDFIRVEFASFIDEDKILSASSFLIGGFTDGFPLDYLLMQLLKITIAYGMEKATSIFDKCTKETQGSFQYIALLDGIRLKREINVFEGIRLVPLPKSTSEFPHYLRNHSHDAPEDFFSGKILLVVDCSVFPIFHKPFRASTMQEHEDQENRIFRIGINSKDFPNLKVDSFPLNLLCQALSLACHSEVKISFVTRFLAADKLYNLSQRMGGSSWNFRPSGNVTKASQSQIDDSKRLYAILINLDTDTLKELQIPIDRWIKSAANKDAIDKIIDLGIAFESLYLADRDGNSELSFQLRLRAAWYLGENKAHRKELMKDFSKIYEWRSKVVHTGKFPNKTRRTPFTRQEIEEFIKKAQDLCRDSILKILEEGKFPDYDYWNNLILG